jgi:hypothetical protein
MGVLQSSDIELTFLVRVSQLTNALLIEVEDTILDEDSFLVNRSHLGRLASKLRDILIDPCILCETVTAA